LFFCPYLQGFTWLALSKEQDSPIATRRPWRSPCHEAPGSAVACAPASGYSGENPDWVDGFCLPPREGPGVPPVFGISQQLVRTGSEIAAGLYLSEATVKSHIARILAKLGLRDRVQVAVYAYEHGIVRPGHRTPPPGRGT
jgi:hypothetical protein